MNNEGYDPDYARRVFTRTESRGGHRLFFKDLKVLNKDNLSKTKDSPQRLYLANHLSHADYLMAWIQFHRQEVDMPMIAAGKNLDLKLLNWIGMDFGKLGAFWVDRDKMNGSNRQEGRRLREKVSLLVDHGKDILCFPEGGRNYNGRLFEDYKTGIIKGVLNTKRDIEVVPIAFDYSSRIEEGYLPFMNWVKKKGRIGKVLYVGADLTAYAVEHFSRKNKTAYINIGRPTHLSEITKENTNIRQIVNSVKSFSKDQITNLYQEIQSQKKSG